MPLNDLTDSEKAIVKECLDAVVSGEIILDDWEFPIIFAIEFSELRSIAAAWPDVQDSDETVFLAINGSLNNLLGYPHQAQAKWPRYISVPPSEVARIFSKWRGAKSGNYFEGAAFTEDASNNSFKPKPLRGSA